MSSLQVLSGKIALVTGGGSGIGRAICQKFAKEGAKVIIGDKNEDNANKTLSLLEGSGHAALLVDVSDIHSVKQLFVQIQKFYSQVPDTVINCAGILKEGPVLETSETDFDSIFSVNVKGTFLISKEAAKLMIENKLKGSIINMTSVLAKRSLPNVSIYSATKASIVSLTKSMALELSGSNIRCNAIAPGFINTPMSSGASQSQAARFIQVMVPMKRIGEPEEIAEVALFLSSDKNSYMTGEIVQVSGGLFM